MKSFYIQRRAYYSSLAGVFWPWNPDLLIWIRYSELKERSTWLPIIRVVIFFFVFFSGISLKSWPMILVLPFFAPLVELWASCKDSSLEESSCSGFSWRRLSTVSLERDLMRSFCNLLLDCCRALCWNGFGVGISLTRLSICRCRRETLEFLVVLPLIWRRSCACLL